MRWPFLHSYIWLKILIFVQCSLIDFALQEEKT